MSKEAMKMALEALQEVYFSSRSFKHDEAITALREALAEQPAQQTIHCKHRLENNGVCPHHNLHCGWPKCNEPEQPAQQEMTNIERHERNVQNFLAKQPAQRKPLTDEQIVAGARVLNQRMAEQCGVDAHDQWALYADDFKADTRAVLEAALGIKENT